MASIANVLNLVGVTSLLGSEVAKNGVKYSSANKLRIYTSLLIIPGVYNIATQLLKRNDNKLALIFSSGEREDKKKIVGFKSNYKYKYDGMQSGTKFNVSNVLFEGWLNKKNKKKKKDINKIKSVLFENDKDRGGRETKIGLIKVYNHKSDNNIIINEKWLNIFSIFFQIATIAMFILIILENDVVAIIVTILNMLSYFLIILILTSETYKIPECYPNKYSPKGNSIVTNSNSNDIWIVLGNEQEIQNLLQSEIIVEKNTINQNIEIMISVFCCLVTVSTILLTPIMNEKGKIYYSISLLIGLFHQLLYSSRDGDSILEKLTEKHYNISEPIYIDFTNRSSAIAYALLMTEGESNQLGNLLPENNDWNIFRKILDELVNSENLINLENINNIINDINKLYNINEIKNIFKNIQNRKLLNFKNKIFGERLLNDILEALIENYKWNNQSIDEKMVINLEL